jgi:hypothetical protein
MYRAHPNDGIAWVTGASSDVPVLYTSCDP